MNEYFDNSFDFDFGFDFDEIKTVDNGSKKRHLCDNCKKNSSHVKSFVRKGKNIYRKAFSEINLFDVMPQKFEKDDVIHVISGGDVDSLTFVKYLMRFQTLDYLLFSTWCMAVDDVLCLDEWVEEKRINRLDAYVGEIFTTSYSQEYKILEHVVSKTNGRICIFRNHSKVYAGKGDKFSFVIESSANINTNPRAENTVITIGDEIFLFYKDHFDSIKSFSNDFLAWSPYEI